MRRREPSEPAKTTTNVRSSGSPSWRRGGASVAASGCSEHLGSQRVAREHGPRQVGAGQGDRAGPREPGHQPVRRPGSRVLVGHDERHPPQDRSERAGDAREAAEGQHDRWSPAADEHDGLHHGAGEAPERSDVGDTDATLDPASGEQCHVEACLGHGVGLDATLGSDEVDARARMATLDQLARHGEAGQQVPSGPTAGDDRPGRRGHPRCAHRSCAIDTRMPTAAMHIINEEPP